MFPYLLFIRALVDFVQYGFSFCFAIIAEWGKIVLVVHVVVSFLIYISDAMEYFEVNIVFVGHIVGSECALPLP